MDKLIITLVAFLSYSHIAYGYPSAIQTLLGQYAVPSSYLRPAFPVSFGLVQQKQPLQLRPPSTIPVALPNAIPPVTVVHAKQHQVVRPVLPASPVPAYPTVVAIHAQQQPNKIVLPVATQLVQVPNYSFGYAVKDAVTGDEKSHEETRTGDNVVGKYTVVEPDGTLRTVTYTAGINGFNAIVERTPGYAPPNAPPKVVAISRPVVSFPTFGRPVQPSLGVPTYPAGFHFGG